MCLRRWTDIGGCIVFVRETKVELFLISSNVMPIIAGERDTDKLTSS